MIGLPQIYTSRPEWHKDVLACLILAFVGFVLYSGTLHVPWYFDDFINIVENPLLRVPEQALQHLFSPRGPAYASFALNYLVHGESLPGFHLLNIVIHLLSTGFIFLIVKRLPGFFRWQALAAALVFVSHPIQTQSVTYIVQRMTSLAGLFLFIAVYCFMRAKEAGLTNVTLKSFRHVYWYFLSLMFCMLAVITKQNTAFLPLGLLLCDRLLLNSRYGWRLRQSVMYLMPFVLIVILYAVWEVAVPLFGGSSLQSLAYTAQPVTPFKYFVTELSVVWIYLWRMLVPLGLVFDYGYPVVTKIVTLQNVASCAGVIVTGTVAYRIRKTCPIVTFAVAWFFAALAVESSFIPLDPVFEHRLYVPMFGFALLVSYLLGEICNRRTAIYILAVILALYSLLTIQRNILWTDPVAFLEDNMHKAPGNPRLLVELGAAYAERGRFDAAESVLLKAVELKPNNPAAYERLGKILAKKGEQHRAILSYRKAIAVDPSFLAAYLGLGRVYEEQGDYEEAEAVVRSAIRLAPREAAPFYDLGIIMYDCKKHEQSLEAFQAAAELSPNNLNIMFNLSIAMAENGRLQAARELVPKVSKMNAEKGNMLQNELDEISRRK